MSRLQSVALGRSRFGLDSHNANNTCLPADASANRQRDVVSVQFHDLGKVGSKRFTYQSACLTEKLIKILGLQRSLPERCKDVLLPE